MTRSNVRGLRSAFLVIILTSLMILSSYISAVSSSASDSSWEVEKLETKLPIAVYRASAVWTGEKAYIFSGRVDTGQVETIIEFDPEKEKAVIKEAKVVKARVMAAAAWIAPYAYIFGGANFTESLDDVLRYDPANDKIEVMPYKMPEPIKGITAVAADGYIYISGGKNLTSHVSKVLKFDPADGSFVEIQPFPTSGGGRAGVYSGSMVYVFGGECESAIKCETAFEIDPKSDTSRAIDIKDPELTGDYYLTTAVWAKDSALIFGGNDFNGTMDRIMEFSPDDKGGGTFKEISPLPKPLELATSIFDGSKAYIFGGRSMVDPSDNIIVVSKSEKDSLPPLKPERVAIVLILMAVVIAVVVIQSYTEKKKEPAKGPPKKAKIKKVKGRTRKKKK